jgi:hypothetical protein
MTLIMLKVELGPWSITYGYLDAKPTFTAKYTANGELHMKITISKDNDIVWVCGQLSNALAHAVFYIDTNKPNAAKGAYEPSENRILWTKKRYVGMECKELSEIPTGTHVLSVSNQGDKPIQISHLIVWQP